MSTEQRRYAGTQPSFFAKGVSFLKRQEHDWKVTVARTSLERFAYQMVFPYLAIYIMALGATATQLGVANSVAMLVAGVFGPFVGWLIDRNGPKRVYIIGIILIAVSYLIYGISQVWTVAMAAMMAYWLGFSVSIQSCATVCGNCLQNKDRATGMTICETVAAGLLGMAGPMLGAWLVASSGGASANGIRPLFFVGLVTTVGSLLIVWTLLSNRRWGMASGAKTNIFRDIGLVLSQGHNLKRWLIIASVNYLPLGMVFPFSQAFAHNVKGASTFVLGAIVTGSALAAIVFSVPMGRLADRVGRKKVLYLTMPVFWASNLLLVWAPSPLLLVAAGVLQGSYLVGAPVSAAIERELVPAEHMGRWIGIARFFRMLTIACMAFVSGLIWDKIGAQYVFLTFVGLDLVIRMPLLIGMPETLNRRLGPRAGLVTHESHRGDQDPG